MSTFLYTNHIYNDVIFVTLTTIVIYITTKEKLKIKDILELSILLFLQYIIRPVGIILIIAVCMYLILNKNDYKTIIAIISSFIVCYLIYIPIQKHFIPESEENLEYPIWSFIQMGINKEEFGFQDNTHSTEWTYSDVLNRVKELKAKGLMTLLAKKQFWLWTEGTYQVQRYVFGIGSEDTFYYETPVTSKLNDPENSKIRKAIDYIMKGQYFVLILLSLVDLIKDKNTKKDLLLYFIIGLFCFYTIWEIKSRYIYCLYPAFLILAVGGIEKILKKTHDCRYLEKL